MALLMLGCLGIGLKSAGAQTLSPGRLAAGYNHTLAVHADGTVRAWGDNHQGQLGNNSQSSTSTPVTVSGLTEVTAAAGGGDHSLALKSDGTVWAWGLNTNGQLGNGSTNLNLVPVQVSNLISVIGLAAGSSHTLALKSDGTVWTWGLNDHGQLGDSSMTQRLVPVQVTGLANVVAVAAGRSHSYALKSDGTVWAWGVNDNGQLGNNSTTQSLTPVLVNGLTDVLALTSGDNHGLVVKSDGTAWAWGYNHRGQLGNDTQTNSLVPVQVTGLTGVTRIAGGSAHSTALLNDGSVRAWGYNELGQLGNNSTTLSTVPVTVLGLSGVSVIASGANHTMALKSDGSVWGTGRNNEGQLGSANSSTSNVPVPVSGINGVQSIGIGAGASHTLSVKSDGTVWCVGHNDQGQLGDNTRTNANVPVAVSGLVGAITAAGGGSHSLSVKSDGTVRAWGLNSSGQLGNNSTSLSMAPVTVSGLGNVTAVSAGSSHSLALKNDGTVWAWGLNANGQLGNNSLSQSLVPVQVSRLIDVIAISAGSYHSLALKSDGSVWAWGINTYGQLGDKGTSQSLVPVQVAGVSGVIAVAAGSCHSLVLKSDGTVLAWGYNNHGQLGDDTQTNSLVPVTVSGLTNVISLAGGGSHSIALKSDGTVWSWGDNVKGQLSNNSTTLSMVPVQASGMLGGVAVAAGANYSMVLKEDGTIATWGDSPNGQLAEGMSANLTSLVAIKVTAFNVLHTQPSVEISSPANNTVLAMGQTQTVDVNFTAAEGSAASVSLYHHGILLGTDTVAPFSFNFRPWTYGDFSLTALGIDSLGYDSLRSTAVNIKVPFDSDLDGLPDWWELRYFATLSTSPSADADNDGLNNLGEYVSDNLPNDMDKDTDNDGVLDAVEFAAQHHLLVSNLVSITANKTQRSVELSWQNNYANATSYRIQKSMNAGVTWTDAATVAPTTTNFTVTSLQPGVNYHFRVVTESVYGSFTGNSICERTFPKRIAVGDYHQLAIHADGTVSAWGKNVFGQLGNGSTKDSLTPLTINGLMNVVAVSCGGNHSLAVKSDGTVWAWGANSSGQLGNNSTIDNLAPEQVTGLDNVIAIAAGVTHSLAVKSDGTVWAWGNNSSRQLGYLSNGNGLVPVQVPNLSGAVGVAAGPDHSLVVKNDGTVWGWGSNYYGQLADGNFTGTTCLIPLKATGLTNAIEVVAGYTHSMAYCKDGTIMGWGDNSSHELGEWIGYNSRTPVPIWGGLAISCSGQSSCASLDFEGRVWIWGQGFSHPRILTGLTDVVEIAGGAKQGVAMKGDGSLWTWSSVSPPLSVALPVQVTGLQSIVAADAGANHTLSVKNDGTVWTAGQNIYGQLGNDSTMNSSRPIQVSGLSGVVAVSGGLGHSISGDGIMHSWGLHSNGQLGNGSPASNAPEFLLPGTVDEVDANGNPVNVMGDVASVAAGSKFTLALKHDGTVWTWGYNNYGQLGRNSTNRAYLPGAVMGLSGVVAVAAGNSHSIALKSDGTVWTWGLNSSGQLGNNSTTLQKVPVSVSGLNGVVAIAAGENFSVVVKNDGTVWTWGLNSSGQLGNNSTAQSLVPVQVSGLSGVVAVAGGANHSLAVKSDGTVWAWGANSSGQLGNNSMTNSLVPVSVNGLEGVMAVSCGLSYSLVVKRDGTIVTWGDSTYGQLGEGIMSPSPLISQRVPGINLLHALPSVTITSPADNMVVPLGETQTLDVTFTSAEGAPVSVSFYHYGVLLATADTAPFTFAFEPRTWGDFPITAEGVDSLGVISKRSAVVTFKVPYDTNSDFDSDGDGVYDSWEIAYYGSIMTYGIDNLPDTDGDGYSDWSEYLGETDAADGSNHPLPAGTATNPLNSIFATEERNRYMNWKFNEGWYSYPDPNDNERIISGYNRFGCFGIGNARGVTKYLAEWVDDEYTTGVSDEACVEAVAAASIVGTMPTGYPNITKQLPPFSFTQQWESVSSYSASPGNSLSPSSGSLVPWPGNQGSSEGWIDYGQDAFYDETIAKVIYPPEGPPEIVSAPRVSYTQLRAKTDSGQTYKRSRTYVVVKEERWGTGPSGDGASPLSIETKVLGVATISLNAGVGAKSKVTFQPASAIGSGPEAFAGPDEVKVDGASDAVQALALEPKVSAAHATCDRKGAWIRLESMDLAVDANRDGYINFGSDRTSQMKPLTFWLNDDHDVKRPADAVGLPVFTILGQDDVSDGVKDSDDNEITCVRDLEDFTRLHLSLGPFIDQIKDGTITAGLEFAETNDTNPSIKVYRAFEKDGGPKYLLDNTVGEAQLAESKFNTSCGVISTSSGIKFTSDMWDELSSTQSTGHLIFEGVTEGKGKLQLTLYKGEQKLCSVGEVWLDLKSVKKMYQRWNAKEVENPGVQWDAWPKAVASPDADSKEPATISQVEDEKDFILFVHGWNMAKKDKRLFSETAYKRLWQIGYKGRFGAFYWPTFYTADASPLTEKLDPRNFDGSEHRAWQSSGALLGLFKQLNAKYPGRLHVMAHSMGNVVASEALHKASSVVVKNYISSQSALAADVFKLNPDVTSQWKDILAKTVAGLGIDLPAAKAVTTPNVYAYYFATGRDGDYREQQYPEMGGPYMHGVGGAEKWHNYHNPDDWALGLWIYNQSQKPHTGQMAPLKVWVVPYVGIPIGEVASVWYLSQRSYEYRQFIDNTWGFYVNENPLTGADHGIYTPESTYEIFCYAAQARSNPTGRQTNIGGPFVNKDQKNFSSFGDKHPGHSAQFLHAMSKEDVWPYWNNILNSCQIKHFNPYSFLGYDGP